MAVVQPPQIPLPPKPGKPGGLGEKLEDTFVRVTHRVLNAARQTLVSIIQAALQLFLEALEPELEDMYGDVLRMITNEENTPDEVRKAINIALSGKYEAGATVLLGLGQTAAGTVVGSVLNTLLAPVTYTLNRKTHPWRLDPSVAWRLRRLGGEKASLAWIDAQDMGLDADRWNALDAAYSIKLGISDLLSLYWRKKLDYKGLKDRLHRIGFDINELDDLVAAFERIPGAGDIISMAVREAWNDAVAARFGYDEDFPVEFADWLEKQGYSRDWARRYWRAHWNLPSPTAGYEMLHRGIITENDLRMLLKTADYPRFWRDALIALSYRPFTRVDVRRMYQTGVLKTIDEVIRAYKDIGYNDEKALKLAEFTIKEYGEEARETTKSDVLKAYELGRINHDEALNMLVSIDYQPWIAEVWLANVDNKKANALLKEELKYLKSLYIARELKDSDVHARLSKYSLPANEVEEYLRVWRIQRDAKVRRPTKTDVHDFFIKNIISESEYRQSLRALGYDEKSIEWYVTRSKRYLVEQARKDAESARAEAERLEKAKIKSRYDIEAAEIAVQIAEANLAIADLKASVSPDMTIDEINEIAKTIADYQLLIKQLKLEKAQKRKEYLESIAPQEKGGE